MFDTDTLILSNGSYISDKGDTNMDLNLRNLGIGLMIFGIILLIAFGLYTLLAAEVSPIIRLSLIAIIIGIVIALFSLLKEKSDNKDLETERKY